MEAPRRSRKKKQSKSGVRTKFLIESLRNEYYTLKEENEKLRGLVSDNLNPSQARMVLSQCYNPNAPRVGVNDVDRLAGDLDVAGLSDDNDAIGF